MGFVPCFEFINVKIYNEWPGPDVINIFLCSTPLSIKFKLLIHTEQQISCVSAYFTHISKAKTQLFSKLCVSRTLDIFLIPNCEFLPSVSFVYNQNGACIKTSSQVKPNSTIVILCLPKPDHPLIGYWNV